jgi:hypothetical protein
MPQPMTLYRREVTSVFDLLGHKEVDLTAALGWSLMRSPALMARVWDRLGMPGDPAEVTADLEVAGPDGRTDLELTGTEASVIVEAKKGWLVPHESQLTTYAPRLQALPTRLLVSLSDSSEAWANLNLPDAVDGIAVRHLPWDGIRDDLKAARAATRTPSERLWLDELDTYLAGATAVRHPADQWTYCVVVSNNQFGDQSTFRDFVRHRRIYFHPYGGAGGWPKRPPTFLAFRWQGIVRQVNRVAAYEIVAHLNDRFLDIPRGASDEDDPHIVYDLGPDIPIPTIPTKGIYATARVWALLDQLLTAPTLKDAVDRSKAIDPT